MKEDTVFQKLIDKQGTRFHIDFYQADSDESVKSLLDRFIRPFHLDSAPLARMGLMRIEETRHLLMVDLHHIIADGISLTLLTRDFMALYAGHRSPAPPIRYVDYASWLNSEKNRDIRFRKADYWEKQFNDDIPVIDLPVDHSRPAYQGFDGDKFRFDIPPQLATALKEFARDQGTTLYMVLLSLYHVFLSRLSNQEDIVIGSPAAGRDHADIEQVIGIFLNILSLRNRSYPGQPFTNFLARVKDSTLYAFENSEFPYEELVERVDLKRDFSRNPLFDVMFIFQNMEAVDLNFPGMTITSYDYHNPASKFDLTLEAVEKEARLVFEFEYSTKLFQSRTIRRFVAYFRQVVASVLHDPTIKIGNIQLMPMEEKQRVLEAFNRTRTDYPRAKTIHRLFEEQVQRTPGHPALVCEGETLSFLRLNRKADDLARLLKEKGMEPGKTAMVAVGRSLWLVTSILAVLKTGGAYL
ncbi:MAG: AMP-binding protein, partial [bacterium]|nr:AMP-binding protein [bacterium]